MKKMKKRHRALHIPRSTPCIIFSYYVQNPMCEESHIYRILLCKTQATALRWSGTVLPHVLHRKGFPSDRHGPDRLGGLTFRPCFSFQGIVPLGQVLVPRLVPLLSQGI